MDKTMLDLCCYHCGKTIRRGTKYIHTSPSILAQRLCGDFPKAYHPKCYTAVSYTHLTLPTNREV